MADKKRPNGSYSSGDKVRISVPLPKPGEYAEAEFPTYGLKVLIERMPQESEEQVRARFVVTAPGEGDHRTHAARLGAGVFKPKKMGVTLCTETRSDPKQSGTRITGLGLESVTCPTCRVRLGSEGVQLQEQKGDGS